MIRPLDSIQCPHRADERNFLLVGQCGLCVCSYFTTSGSASLLCISWFVRWEVSGSTVAVLKSAASYICSKQHTAYLCSSHWAFSEGVLLGSKWCSYIILLTLLQLWRILVLFYQRSDFKLSITDEALPMHMLKSFSIDEILLPKYLNWFINFSSLSFNNEISPASLKHDFFFSVVETNASCCQLLAMQ